jgi:hypothetical protein
VAYELTTGEQLGELEIDHICHNESCCNPTHLRPVTRQQNEQHRRGANRDSITGVRGVSPHGKRFYARAGSIYLGMFDTVEEAGAAARAKRLELHTHNDIDRLTG